MEPDYKWIAQDADGVIWRYRLKEPKQGESIWLNMDRPLIMPMLVARGTPNPNWRDSLIDLEKEDYEIVYGILVRRPRAEVSRSELTDTELLDAIMEHELLVNVSSDGVRVISGAPSEVTITNKKGDIRKAIKKWLRKNT